MKKNSRDHFDPAVPQSLQDEMEKLADLVLTHLILDIGEPVSSPSKDPIYGIPMAGFIPNQDGGFEVSVTIRFDRDPTYHIDEGMTEAAENEHAWLREVLEWEHGIDQSIDYNDMSEDQQWIYEDWETEWYSSALLRFSVFSRDGEVLIRLSVNEIDPPYYRLSKDRTLKEIEVPAEEFNADKMFLELEEWRNKNLR